MAFYIYYNDKDFSELVMAMQEASIDPTLTAQQRNQITSLLNAGVSAYLSAPYLPPNDPRATNDPLCRRVLVNTNTTVATFLNYINTIISKHYPEIYLSKVLNSTDWFGALEQL